MFKKTLKVLGIILLIGFISVFIRGITYQKEKSTLDNKTLSNVSKSEKQEIIDEDIINSILDQEETKEDTSKESNTKEQNKENSSTNEVKQNTSSSNNIQPKTNNEKVVQSANQQNSTNNDKVQIQPKQVNPWDDLGISEYDYYNSPMWGTWADITYKIENYSSRSEVESACQTESNRLFDEEEKISSCTPMNSYSGRYLGEYLKVR